MTPHDCGTRRGRRVADRRAAQQAEADRAAELEPGDQRTAGNAAEADNALDDDALDG